MATLKRARYRWMPIAITGRRTSNILPQTDKPSIGRARTRGATLGMFTQWNRYFIVVLAPSGGARG